MPESGEMLTLRDKVQNIVSKYEARLVSAGIRIAVSKRYFEFDVQEPSSYSPDHGVGLLNLIDRHFSKKRERKYYKNEKNKSHCIILSVLPIHKNLVRKEYCKDYAFVLRKVWRAHIGYKPERITYSEDKLLSRIEKRILKIVKSAEDRGIQKTCKDTFWDVIRYCFSLKYGYKSKVLGKKLSSWDLIFVFLILILVIVVIVLLLVGGEIGRLFL